jgi:hypothetical protein
MDWVDRHFNVNTYFEYERDLPNIEKFILNLNVFRDKKDPLNWRDRFDIDWNDWNRMHYLLSLVPFDYTFSDDEKIFMRDNIDQYTQARIYIQDMQDAGIMISGIPIKLHTLKQKAKLIKNIDQCLIQYNNWARAEQRDYVLTYTPEGLTETAQLEHSSWVRGGEGTLLTYTDLQKERLMLSDLKFPQDMSIIDKT